MNAICVAGTSLSEGLLSSSAASTGFSAGVSSILKSASADFSNKPPKEASSAGPATSTGFTSDKVAASVDVSAGFSSMLKSASADFSNKLPKESSSASSSNDIGAAFSATGSSTAGAAGAASSAAGSSNLRLESSAVGFSKDSSGRSSSPKMEEKASLTFVSGSSAFGVSATLGASSTTGDSSNFGGSSTIKGSSAFGVSSKLNRSASALLVSVSSSEKSMCIGEAALSAGFSAGSSAT